MSVGQELLDVPLPDMVTKLALGIAAAQHALDANSVETAQLLAATTISVVPAITQTFEDSSGPGSPSNVTFAEAPPIDMSLLQIGLNPTFYQFSEASIEVSMDIKTTTSTETSIKVGSEVKVGFMCVSASIRVDVAHNRKFQKEVHGTSRLFVKLTPVPPPPRFFPEVTIIDKRVPAPATP